MCQNLQARVNNEVMQFMSYLQDVAKICADDYNFISQGAMQYSEVLILQGLHHIYFHMYSNIEPSFFFRSS